MVHTEGNVAAGISDLPNEYKIDRNLGMRVINRMKSIVVVDPKDVFIAKAVMKSQVLFRRLMDHCSGSWKLQKLERKCDYQAEKAVVINRFC